MAGRKKKIQDVPPVEKVGEELASPAQPEESVAKEHSVPEAMDSEVPGKYRKFQKGNSQ